MPFTDRELAEVNAANATDKQPVVFMHGLWLLAGSWDRWRALLEERGYVTLAPGWPQDPETVDDGVAEPDRFAGASVGQVRDHMAEVVRSLSRRTPILVGHSFGGLFVQQLAGMGLAAATVAIDPAPFRGVLPLPRSTLRAALPVLGNPLNRSKSVMLTFEQFRYAFANAVSEDEARSLYETYAVPAPGRPLFQGAVANINWRTEACVNTAQADRGPLLLIGGTADTTIPPRLVHAAAKRYKLQPADVEEIPGRGHSLTIDSGWREVADTALAFLERNGLAPA